MCGIIGIASRSETDRVYAKSMLASMIHRGPDGEGTTANITIGDIGVLLGHRRLSIIDLSSAAAQPMSISDDMVIITFNGEIYNYKEIKSELQLAGISFKSNSDTEVILRGYLHWGIEILSRLNGMFAFAILDKRNGSIFCARDRFGEKPFLFHATNDFFAFASEYKALLLHPKVPIEYDELRLTSAANNQSTGLDADRQTVFAAIEQLLPGEAMLVSLPSLERKIWRYWRVKYSEEVKHGREEDIFASFRELLIDSVRLRLRSDVPVGSCLSGGLDSSAIVGIVRHLRGNDAPYHTFTGRFPGTPADEWSFAKLAVDANATTSHVVEPTVNLFLEQLPDFILLNELPVGSSSQFAQWCVFKLAKEVGVTVLLDGQGSDEILGGYEQYFSKYIESLKMLGQVERLKTELPQIRSRYPLAIATHGRNARDRLPFAIRHWISNSLGIGTSISYGMSRSVVKNLQAACHAEYSSAPNNLSGVLEADSFGRYLTTLLRYGDRNSMAHSREVRLPFCDHRIAEFALNLPPHLLMGEVQTKRLLRESMRGLLPEAIRTRWNKQGFRPPQDLWFKNPELINLVQDTFGAKQFTENEHWIPSWWQRAARKVGQGSPDLAWTLWHPFIIEQWKNHFLNPIKEQRRAAASLRLT